MTQTESYSSGHPTVALIPIFLNAVDLKSSSVGLPLNIWCLLTFIAMCSISLNSKQKENLLVRI